MSIPSDADNANCDSTADDPKLALTVDLKDTIDKLNELLAHLRASGITLGGTTAAMGIGQGLESDGDASAPLLRVKIVSTGGLARGASGLSVDINAAPTETTLDRTNDFVGIYDATDSALNKMTPDNFLKGASEEGSWTPAVTTDGTAGTPAYTTQVGRYIRQGNLVTVFGGIILSGWTGSPSGNVSISGLPFAASGVSGLLFPLARGRMSNINLSAGYSDIALNITAGASAVAVQEIGDNVAAQNVTAANFGTLAVLFFSGTYRIN